MGIGGRKVQDRPEDWLSRAVRAWLDLPQVQIRGRGFHVPNEEPDKVRAAIAKKLGVEKGVADWIWTGPPLVAVELKWGRNTATESQLEWGKDVQEGWPRAVEAGLLDPVVEGLGDLQASQVLDVLGQVLRPRYFVAKSLTGVARILHTTGVLESPRNREGLKGTIQTVQVVFAASHGRNIP